MSDERKRPGNNRDTTDEKTNDRGRTPNQGLSWWLSRAPESASFIEVYNASEEYDRPDEAWPDNHDLDDYADDPVEER